MESGKMAAFPALNAFSKKEFDLGIRGIFLEHLTCTSFLSELDRYITSHNFNKAFNWMRIPFVMSALQVYSEIDCIGKQLVVLQSRQLWKEKYKIVSLPQVWAKVQSMKLKGDSRSGLYLQARKTIYLFQLPIFVKMVFQH